MVETQYCITSQPSAVRFPRGSGYGREALLDLHAPSPGDQTHSRQEEEGLLTAADREQLAANLRDVHAAYGGEERGPVTSAPSPTGRALSVGKGRLVKAGAVSLVHVDSLGAWREGL